MTVTIHGHHIPGTTKDDESSLIGALIMRCGGVRICVVCKAEAEQYLGYKAMFEDTSEYASDPDRFLKLAKLKVVSSYNSHHPEHEAITVDNLYIVWFAKTLQNWKALVSSNIPSDGMYFEVTYDGNKEATYVDTYLKIANDAFTQEAGH